MSRSYRHKPYSAIGNNISAQEDKTMAAKAVRRTCRKVLHVALKQEDYDVVLPLTKECTHNNVYGWVRDGKQRWCGLDSKDWVRHIRANTDPTFYRYNDEDYMQWPPLWFKRMLRK